jgi:hypothetical protein
MFVLEMNYAANYLRTLCVAFLKRRRSQGFGNKAFNKAANTAAAPFIAQKALTRDRRTEDMPCFTPLAPWVI